MGEDLAVQVFGQLAEQFAEKLQWSGACEMTKSTVACTV
jgi:hypothetical protein